MKEGDLVRVVSDAPRPWAGQMGIVIKRKYFLPNPGKVVVYLFRLKQEVPFGTKQVILVSTADD